MGGGLMQLVAYGAQDIYLTGNPQITFFKVVYRRHTNFSMEQISQNINGIAGWNNSITAIISRVGDLLHKVCLEWYCPTDIGQNVDQSGNLNKRIRIPNNFGHYMIDTVDISIGSSRIDRITGHWMEVYSRLTVPNPTKHVGTYTNNMIVNNYSHSTDETLSENFHKSHSFNLNSRPVQNTLYQQMTGASGVDGIICTSKKDLDYIPKFLQIPFPFWFCKNPGLALPLIALQYHEVAIKIKFQNRFSIKKYTKKQTPTQNNPSDISSLLDTTNDDGLSDELFSSSGDNVKLLCEYIFLDTDERRRFAQVSHEYLIEQLQIQENTNRENRISLYFNHPVKELIFSPDWGKNQDIKNIFPDPLINPSLYLYGGDDDLINNIENIDSTPGWLPSLGDYDTTVSLKLNNIDRFSSNKPLYYFTRYQIFNHHPNGPGQLYSSMINFLGGEGQFQSGGTTGILKDTPINQINDSIGVYSFALKPDDHQPSGTCNFSRIDNATLSFENLKVNPTAKDVQNFSETIQVQEDGTATTINPQNFSNLAPDYKLIVYAVNYNVLRIMSGMGGLAYSN